MNITEIKDLIYFDFSKAHSIYSQLTGGLIQQIQTALENTDQIKGDVGFNLQLLRSKIEGDHSEKKSQIETKSLHHDLLNKLEKELKEFGVLLDINVLLGNYQELNDLRNKITPNSYIKVEGWTTIEDYEKIIATSSKFNEIAEFIADCAASSNSDVGELKDFKENLKNQRTTASLIKDKNEKQKQLSKLNQLEKDYNALVESIKPDYSVDEKYLNGLLNFLKVFFPKRINFRVYPDERFPSFQFFSNLKRDCFVDIDSDNFSTSYGSTPNVKLTMFGLVTSLPSKELNPFNTLSEFDNIKNRSEHEIEDYQKNIFIENALRGVFKAFESFEDIVRQSRYPNVTIFPIAVYRKIVKGE